MRLVNNLKDYNCFMSLTQFRTLLDAFFAAASSVLCNLTRNPTSPDARLDLHLVKPFLRLLERLAGDAKTSSQSETLRRMRRTCDSLNREAKQAVQLSI